jgi:hypothetical protein
MKLNKRGVIVMWTLAILIVSLFTYATRDICYVGNMEGNFVGYGSCTKMIDEAIDKVLG